MANLLPPPEDESYGHPSHDTSNRFEVDALLRRHGYKIVERRKGKEAIWLLSGVRFSQSEALIRLDSRIVADARYLEEMDREADLYRDL